jgi:MFS family permease
MIPPTANDRDQHVRRGGSRPGDGDLRGRVDDLPVARPLIGGLFTEYLDWRWVFWINLPLGMAPIRDGAVDQARGRVEGGQRIGVPGLVTLVPGLTALVLALMEASDWGWGSLRTIVLLAGGILLSAAFVAVERRSPAPLVELRLFGVRNFRADSVVLFFAQFALIGLTIFGAIFTQDLLGFSPIEAGLGMSPITLPLLVAAPLAGGRSHRPRHHGNDDDLRPGR